MLLGSCRSTLSRSLSAVSVSSLSLSWVISVKSVYCGNMALDDFAILLILSQKNSRRLLTLTTNYFKQFPSVLILFFSIWDFTFLFFHLSVISLLVHLILISISLCYPVFPHPGPSPYFPTNCSNSLLCTCNIITFYQSEWFCSLLRTYITSLYNPSPKSLCSILIWL